MGHSLNRAKPTETDQVEDNRELGLANKNPNMTLHGGNATVKSERVVRNMEGDTSSVEVAPLVERGDRTQDSNPEQAIDNLALCVFNSGQMDRGLMV